MGQKILLSSIEANECFQPRQFISEEDVLSYATQLQEGAEFPPIVVFRGEHDAYILASGFHRFEAYKKLKLIEVDAEIREGTQLDILVEAIQSNSRHGLKYSNEDKWRCVSLLLKNEEAKNWSDNGIAKICGVSNHLVKKVRLELNPDEPKDPNVISIRGGYEVSVDTSNIGANNRSEKATLQSVTNLLNTKSVDIARNLRLFRQTYDLPEIEIPSELDEAIYEFVNWYNSKKVVGQ